ncbi:hypothetical protein ACOSP7_014556 [Xanthoceras sorbifolium]
MLDTIKKWTSAPESYQEQAKITSTKLPEVPDPKTNHLSVVRKYTISSSLPERGWHDGREWLRIRYVISIVNLPIY